MLFSAGVIFFLAGTVQGVAGFGAGLVAIPLLCLIMDIKIAVPLCILNGLIITSYLVFTLRHHLDFRKIMPLLLGALPGIPAGVVLLKHVDQGLLQVFIGIILISYSLYNLLVKPKSYTLHVGWGYFAGFLTGAITAALSAGGPPAIVYTTMTDWKKDVIKATLTGFFVINACLAFIVQMMNGIITQQVVWSFLGTAPFVLAGTVFGSMLSGRLDRATYLRLIYYFLTVMGIMMVIPHFS